MVGSPQDIQCTMSTVSGVELSSVMISWMGPGGDTIRNDSRVTISPTSGSGNNYTSSLQFMYLMEGDEGTYECNVMILETNELESVELQNLISKLVSSYLYMHTIPLFRLRFDTRRMCMCYFALMKDIRILIFELISCALLGAYNT